MKLRALSVSELNRYIKKILNSDPILNHIMVKGEISNIKIHSSGHIYFSLKDEISKINCVLFKDNNERFQFVPDNGMQVIAKGYVSIFERDGQYQFYINEIQPDGIGALHLAFEQLKNKLDKEGFFDRSRKKKIPNYPQKIAIVTSPTGAAIKDIISIIQRRNRLVNLIIYPVLVQGERAGEEIANAIDRINEMLKDVDLIIIGRGGGSLEELWAFNEEVVAKSIYHSQIPIISAVGHETDYTIADFVADLRASTPSEAAELAVPHSIDIKYFLENAHNQLYRLFIRDVKEKRSQLETINVKKLFTLIYDRIQNKRQVVDMQQKNILSLAKLSIETHKTKLISEASKLEAMNPLTTILRGYAIALDNENIPIISVNAVNKGDYINVMLTDGYLSCIVKEKKKEDYTIERYRKS